MSQRTYNSRIDFERNINLAKYTYENGNMGFNRQTRGSELKIKNIKTLPNGRVNLLTIDESIRSMLLAISHLGDKNES